MKKEVKLSNGALLRNNESDDGNPEYDFDMKGISLGLFHQARAGLLISSNGDQVSTDLSFYGDEGEYCMFTLPPEDYEKIRSVLSEKDRR